MSTLYAILFYIAIALFIFGLARKIVQYYKTPAPLKIPTTPAPVSAGGVVLRMGREVVLFESLFKSNKWIWLFGWMFHVGLALVVLRHLRYFIDPVWAWVALIQPLGKYGGLLMVAGLVGLWARRFLVNRVRYISTPSDHLWLLILILIGASGALMTFVTHTDVVAVKSFFIGLRSFSIGQLPLDGPLLVHLALVALLLALFPFSKLLHAPGVFFSPSRNQVDNPRDLRHLAPWAAALDNNKSDK